MTRSKSKTISGHVENATRLVTNQAVIHSLIVTTDMHDFDR